MFAILINDLLHYEYWLSNPAVWVSLAFQIWMLVDAIRREEWMWAVFILFFSIFSAVLYFFYVYRAAPLSTRGFELPGAHQRKRIKELQSQIHHLDKAHHYSQLGDIYFQQGKLERAEASYRAAMERDSQDLDTRSHLGQCLMRLNRAKEARPLLESVCGEDPKHDYGYTRMAFAETLAALGETDSAIRVCQQVLENNSYARARVQLAQLYIAKNQLEPARAELDEVLADSVHTPKFHRKQEKVWVRRAKRLLRGLGKG
jgi:hypothetical protein